MKVLTIRQPWAHLIINCGKDVENRDWPTKYRGPLLIHTSASFARAEYEHARDWALQGVGIPEESFPSDALLKETCGGIIGIVDLVDCVAHSDSRWYFGKYGFLLKNPRPLPFTPCKGRLGLWEHPGDIVSL